MIIDLISNVAVIHSQDTGVDLIANVFRCPFAFGKSQKTVIFF
jgi:hypothetical protein